MEHTQIVFVGHQKNQVIDSVRMVQEFATTRLILIISERDQETGIEMISDKIAKDIYKEYSGEWDVIIAHADKINILNAASQLISIIRGEQYFGNKVIINIANSLRSFAIAGYIAACMTGARIVTSVPVYDEHLLEAGIDKIIDVPTLMISVPRKEQQEILNAIGNGVGSLDDLIYHLNQGISKDSEEFFKERSRLSHHLKKMEEDGLITKRKIGKKIRIRPLDLGMVIRDRDEI